MQGMRIFLFDQSRGLGLPDELIRRSGRVTLYFLNNPESGYCSGVRSRSGR
jgi:hypothetical protein